MKQVPFGWLEIERIAGELSEAHPEVRPDALSFPRLKELVESLPQFCEEPGHPSNERILEAIQQAWIEERT